MSSESNYKKLIEYYKSLNSLPKANLKQNYRPPLRYTVPLSDFLSEREVYIYNSTYGVPFENLHPEFQRIMIKEFTN